MKVISYALFGDPLSFEYPFYLRGIYFNARMNRLLYPEWTTIVFSKAHHYADIIESMAKLFDQAIFVRGIPADPSPKRCEGMLWRMKPIYLANDISHVICRDADAITTYKEAQAVQEWVDSGLGFHGITDDPAHTIPMMGGMCGFRKDHFHSTFPEYNTFWNLIGKDDTTLTQHGSDQNLLMKKIYPKAKDNMMGHFFEGCHEKVKVVTRHVSNQIPGVNPKLWESNLCARMIGSPGVVDMEVLRFFKRFDNNKKFDDFEREFPQIMYWAK